VACFKGVSQLSNIEGLAWIAKRACLKGVDVFGVSVCPSTGPIQGVFMVASNIEGWGRLYINRHDLRGLTDFYVKQHKKRVLMS